MDNIHVRAVIVAFLQDALKFAEEIEDSTTAYLIERALDETGAKEFSSVATPEKQDWRAG
jgi:hypothetical protein